MIIGYYEITNNSFVHAAVGMTISPVKRLKTIAWKICTIAFTQNTYNPSLRIYIKFTIQIKYTVHRNSIDRLSRTLQSDPVPTSVQSRV